VPVIYALRDRALYTIMVMSTILGIPFNTAIAVSLWYDIWVRHTYLPVAFINHVIGFILSNILVVWLLYRRHSLAALWAVLIMSTCSVLIGVWLLRQPGAIVYVGLVMLPAAFGLTPRTQLFYLAVTTLLYGLLVIVDPDLNAADWISPLTIAWVVGVGAIGVGNGYWRILNDFAATIVASETAAVARARAEEQAARDKELAAANTRNEIAGQLHDSLGHYLTLLNLQSEAVAKEFERNPASARESLYTIQTLAKEASTALRRSVMELHTTSVDQQPFVEALRAQVRESTTAGVQTDLHLLGTQRLLPASVNSIVYSAVQECLTNVHKHAQATQALLTLDYRCATRIQVIVHDNGQGGMQVIEGHGLQLMRERVVALGGTFRTVTGAGQGFTVELEVPT
jgi:signal transduction histidine kinase